MIAAMRRGDKVITNGGLVGTVSKVTDDSEYVDVEIAKDVKVQIVRSMVADIKSKSDS